MKKIDQKKLEEVLGGAYPKATIAQLSAAFIIADCRSSASIIAIAKSECDIDMSIAQAEALAATLK